MADTFTVFTAIPVPQEFGKAIAQLPKTVDGKWHRPEDLHITIRYLGRIDPGRLDEIKSALEKVKFRPFGIEVSGMGIFRNRRQSVLYADVKSTRKLNHLCAETGDVLKILGFDFGTRPYLPHITIARFGKNAPCPDEYADRHGSRIRTSWEAGGFSLFESSFSGDSGKRYREIDRFDFSD